MTVYVIKCEHGKFRYFEMVNKKFACTRKELFSEVIHHSGVNKLHVAGFAVAPNIEVARSIGMEWCNERKV